MSLKLLRSISSQNLTTTLSDIESKLEKLNLKLLENKFYQTNRILFTNTANKSTVALFSAKETDANESAEANGKSSSVGESEESSPGGSCTSSSSELGNQQKQSKKKMVRFADTLGFELVTVRVVSNNFLNDLSYWNSRAGCQSDEDEDSYEEECFLSSEEEDVFNRAGALSSSVLSSQCLKSTDPANGQKPAATHLVSKRSHSTAGDVSPDTFTFDNLVFTWRCLFEQPGISPDFYTKLNEKKVSLESIYSSHFKLNGIVRVINLAFVKHVFIRYTINNWSSYNDLDCSYLLNGTNDDKLTDRFMFTVLLDKNSLISTLNENSSNTTTTNNNINNSDKQPMLKLEFAICYQISFDSSMSHSPAASYEQSYWDNNHTNNYQYNCYFKIN